MLDWTVKQPADGGVVAPDERLPWPQTVALGIQHVVAMFGATVLGPLLMGFDPNVAILMSGVGTLIFFMAVGGKVPSYVGSSFAFISVVAAATGYAGQGANANIAVALGGIVICGAVYALIGLVVMASGTGWIERLMLRPGLRSKVGNMARSATLSWPVAEIRRAADSRTSGRRASRSPGVVGGGAGITTVAGGRARLATGSDPRPTKISSDRRAA